MSKAKRPSSNLPHFTKLPKGWKVAKANIPVVTAEEASAGFQPVKLIRTTDPEHPRNAKKKS